MKCKSSRLWKGEKSLKNEYSQKKIDISVVGAFDRFNYGDMLFPHIIEWFAQNNLRKYTLNYFGIRKSDFSEFGAKKTNALKELKYDKNFVIVAGGDTMTAKLEFLYLDCIDSTMEFMKERVLRKLSRGGYKYRIENKMGLFDKYPFDIAYGRTIYNSVGGCGLREVKEKNEIIETLKQALYVGVRDCATYEELRQIDAHLTPDSAVLMSTIWKRETLEQACRKSVLSLRDKDYIVFQMGGNHKKKEYRMAINMIKAFYEREKIAAVLLPLGRAISHGDKKALKSIHAQTKDTTYYYDDITLQEITWVLANSQGFVGTSLHGNLVSLSYGKRTILLAHESTKNWQYWDTWLHDSNCCLSSFEMLDADVKWIKGEIRTDWLNQQKQLVYAQFEKMASYIKTD